MKTLLAVLFLTANAIGASAQDLFSGSEPVAFTRMQPVASGQHVRGYPIPSLGSPASLLHLASSSSTGTGSSVEIGRVYTVDIRERKFFGSMEMRANLSQSNMSDWVDEPCKRDDFIWKRSTGGKFSNINCATINHITRFYQSPTGVFQEFYRQFKELGVDMPPTVLNVSFTRYSSGGKLLAYSFTVNPEYFGFDRDVEPVWGASSWHKQSSLKEPKKAEFLANLSRWAVDMQDRVDAAFEKKAGAFSGVLPLTTYFPQFAAVNKPATGASDAPVSKTESRLRSLKDLFEKKLITEQQYKEQVEAELATK